jgi:dihydrofolate reductase
MEGPEYLAWLGENPEGDYLVLMGANSYRLMYGLTKEGEPGTDVLGGLSKVVFSSTLTEPLEWENSTLVTGDAADAVREMKENGDRSMRTRQPHFVPLAAGSRPCRPVPSGDVPGHHRRHRPGTDL